MPHTSITTYRVLWRKDPGDQWRVYGMHMIQAAAWKVVEDLRRDGEILGRPYDATVEEEATVDVT